MRRSWGVAAGRGIGAFGGALVCLSALHALGGCSDILGMDASRVSGDANVPERSDGPLTDGLARNADVPGEDVPQENLRPSEGGPSLPAESEGAADGSTTADAHSTDTSESPLESPVEFDEAKLRAEVIEKKSIYANVLPTMQGILGAFIDERFTLVLSESAQENARRIERHLVNKSDGTCYWSSVANTASAENTITFRTCLFPNGLSLQGKITYVVSKADASEATPPAVHVRFSFENVSANGAVFGGTVNVSTSDLMGYPIDADLAVRSYGTLPFHGTGHVVTNDVGSETLATVTGAGSFAQSGAADASAGDGIAPFDLGTNGWTCTPQDAGNYRVAELRRALKDCYPHGGTLEVSRVFTCIKGASVRKVTTKTTLVFSENTRASGRVTAQVSTAAGETSTTSEPVSHALPWTCPLLDGSDAGADVP